MRVLSAFVGLLGLSVGQTVYPHRYLGYFETPSVAFASIDDYFGKPSVYITSFFSLAGGQVRVAEDIASYLDNLSAIPVKTILDDVVWPNEVHNVPDKVFGPNFAVVSGGFLVPGAQTGQVTILDKNTGKTYQVSRNERGFFYHQAEFIDMDGDGLLDILTAKVNFPSATNGKMVWFKNPGTMTFPWQESVLINPGPDVFFRLHDFDGDGKEEIVASVFFNQKLSIFYNNGSYINPNDWHERIVDNKLGAAFDVRVTDLNKDGRSDLLVTNHQNKLNESAVFAYEVPDNFISGAFTRHIIAMGFDTTQPGEGQASPGSAVDFHPITSRTDEKPYILAAGDGTQRAHLIRPLSQNPRNWDYDMNTLIFVDCTVGGVAVADVDNDGYTEMFVPAFENGQVHVYTFAPSK